MAQEINYARRWAEFITDTRFSDLPADVVHRMKRSLLDVLGVGVIGSRNRSSRILLSFLKSQGGVPAATIIPDGVRTTSVNAALAFGSYVDSADLAESFTRGVMHAGNVVPPAALAEAEKQGATGKDLLTAMAVGYEIAIRVGLARRIDPNSPTFAAKPDDRPDNPNLGFSHPVASFGVYGAAAAAAKLLQLDIARTREALTLGSSISPTIGLSGGSHMGSMNRDLYEGYSNALGVTAAELAALGFTGPRDVTGHFSAIAKDYAPEVLVRGLGSEFLISSGGLHFKLHQCGGMTQSVAAALLDALKKKKVKPADIAQVDVLLNTKGTRPPATDIDPRDDAAAKLSIPYVVSALVTFHDQINGDPHFIELYSDEKLANPERRALAAKVKVAASAEFDKGFDQEWPMRFPAQARIQLTNGETVSGEAEIWAISSRLSDDQVIAKFKDLAGRVLPKDRLDLAVEKVFSIDKLQSVDEVIRAVCL